ncbi:DoxX family protein [Roseivivax sediminis]|uniref:Putative oxidoreductase n=1 Tax=Roseivivax sediminis TaxID=936889 RepID=A0A1I2DBR2_9RHOB|nr:DoxX family protein [Roseivivax sediminis]SFE77964.1 putative oxidoreductase [Roseivivax sediminis]
MGDIAVFVGRLLIAALFAAGFAQKIADPGAATVLLTDRGLPGVLVWPAAAFNLGAALALVAGWRVTPVAALLAFYCAITSLFHLVPEDPWQMSIFVKNWAIAGGCLCLAAQGGGRYRIARLR